MQIIVIKKIKKIIVQTIEARDWQVIIGIEPDKEENIDDIIKMEAGVKPMFSFQSSPSRNAPCPCGSGKQYKRYCGK